MRIIEDDDDDSIFFAKLARDHLRHRPVTGVQKRGRGPNRLRSRTKDGLKLYEAVCHFYDRGRASLGREHRRTSFASASLCRLALRKPKTGCWLTSTSQQCRTSGRSLGQALLYQPVTGSTIPQ